MAYAFPNYAREVLEQVVREPRFRELTTIPTFAPQSIGLVLFMLTGFAISTYLYMNGQIHWGLATAVNGLMAYTSFTILHDATHRAVSGNRTLNDILGMTAGMFLLPFVSTRVYRFLHMEHHRYTGDKVKDPDEFMVSTPMPLLPFSLAYVELYWVPWYIKRWSSRPVSERIEFAVGISLYGLWHAAWLLSPYAMEFVLLWMIPQRLGLLGNAFMLAHIQHPEGVQWETDPFQATAYIKGGKLRSVIMLGQDVHQIHHLLPSVPWYNYHAAWNAGKHLFEQHNIPLGGLLWRPKKEDIIFRKDTGNSQSHWLESTVIAVRDVAEGVREYELKPANNGRFPSFTAGSHIDVQIKEGLVRQYSISNSPKDHDRYMIAVKKDEQGKGGSRTLHETIAAGDTLKISEPRNLFPLGTSAKRYSLVAGGIGITPVLSMAHELYARGADFELHICARDKASLPFSASLNDLPFSDRIQTHLNDGDEKQKFAPARNLGSWSKGRELYICGPSGFMQWVEAELKPVAWPDKAIFSETFVAPKVETADNERFEVELARSGKVLTVEPDEFLLDVLNNNGCGVECSCSQGICGSCITPVLAGEPEHRDAIMTDAERQANDKMCVCVGRARAGSKLVLDL